MNHSYACCDYPGMESCPASFVTGTEEELWKVIELHAAVAHDEVPADWTDDDRSFLATLISHRPSSS